MPIIQLDNISKTYTSGLFFKKKKQALTNVSLSINKGEILGIIGLNGAGKSSTIRILMGFSTPDSGAVTINGESVNFHPHRSRIGYLPENPSLYPHLSPKDHLKFSCRIAGLSAKEEHNKIQAALDRVGLGREANQPIKNFSKGMTQRAALAYAILLEPEILIMDEPMSGLDPLGQELIINIITECRQRGATVLFCSHILHDVERLCSRIGIMHNGKLQAIATPDTIPDVQLPDTIHNTDKLGTLEKFFLHVVTTN